MDNAFVNEKLPVSGMGVNGVVDIGSCREKSSFFLILGMYGKVSGDQ